MTSRTTERFRKRYAHMSVHVQAQARQAYRCFNQNPHHPGLRFKKVHSTRSIYSVRISMDYRALGVVDGDEIIWFWIGSHSEYNGLLTRL